MRQDNSEKEEFENDNSRKEYPTNKNMNRENLKKDTYQN